MGTSILAGRDWMALDNGMRLRLLSALEVLEARREAEELAQEERERPLCSNACLLSRALETQDGEAVFASGRQVLSGLRIEEIAALADTWSRFNQAENPSLTMDQEQAERLKKHEPRMGRSGCAGRSCGPSAPCPPRSGSGRCGTGSTSGAWPTWLWTGKRSSPSCVPAAVHRRRRRAAPCAAGRRPAGRGRSIPPLTRRAMSG